MKSPAGSGGAFCGVPLNRLLWHHLQLLFSHSQLVIWPRSMFDYLLAKIENAPIRDTVFPHIYIENLFEPAHFEAIVTAPEINFPPVPSDEALFETLDEFAYEQIQFPGCTPDRETYLDWRRSGGRREGMHTAVEGFGAVLRLTTGKSPIIEALMEFIESERFNQVLADRFGIDLTNIRQVNAIQKYLDGYEISPHPDVRAKALTYMVNINPHSNAETLQHHTHYLKFKPGKNYIQRVWEQYKQVDRCWVPWDWCHSQWQQSANNSMVIFAPCDSSMHAVKACYNHLNAQRTQIYGNHWMRGSDPSVRTVAKPSWEQFEAEEAVPQMIADLLATAN